MKTKIIFSAVVVSMFVLTGCASDTGRYPSSEDAKGGGGERGGGAVSERGNSGGGTGNVNAGASGRSHGTPDTGRDQPVVDHSGHPVIDGNNHAVKVPVIQDHRPAQEIRNDNRVHEVAFHDVRIVGHWDNYYPGGGWFGVWGLRPDFRWSRVTSVTCEAVNATSNELYPASGLTNAGWAWSDVTVNTLLGQALDDCDTDPLGAKDANGNVSCVPASPSCTPTYAGVFH